MKQRYSKYETYYVCVYRKIKIKQYQNEISVREKYQISTTEENMAESRIFDNKG